MWEHRRPPRSKRLHPGRLPQTSRRHFKWTRESEASTGKLLTAGQNSFCSPQSPTKSAYNPKTVISPHVGAPKTGATGPQAATSTPLGAAAAPGAKPTLAVGGYVKKRSHQLVRVSPRGSSAQGKPVARSDPGKPPAGDARPALSRQGRHKLVRQGSIITAAAKALVRAKPVGSLKFKSHWMRPGAFARPLKPAGKSSRGGSRWPPSKTPFQGSKAGHHSGLLKAQLRRKDAPGKLVRISEAMYKIAKGGKSLHRQPLVAATSVPSASKAGKSSASPGAGVLPKTVSPSRQRLLMLQRLRQGVPGKWSLSKAPLPGQGKRRAAQQTLVSQIKQRSKFVNSLCLDFCRRGTCSLKAAGKCRKVHDPNKVAVCHFWLAGKCNNADCLLQHRAVPDLMPLCLHFAKGSCSTLDCPYLHVKHDAKAPICKDFLEGFCAKGAACSKRHLTAKMVRVAHSQSRAPSSQVAAGRRRGRDSQAGSDERPSKRQAVDSSQGPQSSRPDAALLPEFLRDLC